MSKYLYSFLTLILLLATSCGVKPTQLSQVDKTSTKFQSVLDSIYKSNPESIGIMVHVEAPDKNISWSGAAGVSDKNTKKVLQADQPVLIASNVKTYVSVTILRLIEQGKLNLDQPIEGLLTNATKKLLEGVEYNLKEITIAHLMSHTSGIADYANENYLNRVDSIPKHRWTRDEQIKLAVDLYEPLGKAGDTFSYADFNYLLLTEIIEQVTGQKFYTAMRELIGYKKHSLNSTWFITLEEKPTSVKPLAHQYYGKMGWDSYDIDPSFDLYGGGGIAATTKDLARFSQLLFEGEIFKKPETLNLIYTKIETKDKEDPNYRLGLSKGEVNGFTSYGHGGFWGTAVNYYPELNTSISVFVLERDKGKLRRNVLEGILDALNKTP